jgi:hypothetical protein
MRIDNAVGGIKEGSMARTKKADNAQTDGVSPVLPEEIVEAVAEEPAQSAPDLAPDSEPDSVADEVNLEPVPAASDTVDDIGSSALPIPQEKRRGGFWPLFFGGAIATGLGFGAAVYLATTYPEALGIGGSAGVDQRLSDHDKRLTDLAGALAAIPQGADNSAANDALRADLEAENKAVVQAVGELEGRQIALEARIAALTTQLEALESLPAGAAAASAAQVAAATEAAAQQALAAQEDAAQVKAKAEAMAQQAQLGAALSELKAAFEAGTALDGPLKKMTAAGVTVPEALASQAQGVPTQAALRQSFPAAARAALAASLAETVDGGLADRLTAFVRSQTGARSLTPRAGEDPDAILSRAEAALGTGDLKTALVEIATLPEAGRTRLAEWTGLAERRLAAAAAIAALAADME